MSIVIGARLQYSKRQYHASNEICQKCKHPYVFHGRIGKCGKEQPYAYKDGDLLKVAIGKCSCMSFVGAAA